MNITKYLLIPLFSLLPTVSLAQKAFELDCENGFETIETEVESQEIVSYKIIYSQKLYTEESFEFSEAIVVVSDLNNKISTEKIIEIIVRIGVKNKLSKVLAFKTCKAVEFYFQQPELTPEQADYIDKNLLPNVEIDLNKSLSKKDRKKNKRKRDLIELVSKESCEELKKLKIDKVTMEHINQVVTNTSVQNVKKIEKVYELSFEESTIKFLEDLTNHLFVHCELIKEHIKQFKGKSE